MRIEPQCIPEMHLRFQAVCCFRANQPEVTVRFGIVRILAEGDFEFRFCCRNMIPRK